MGQPNLHHASTENDTSSLKTAESIQDYYYHVILSSTLPFCFKQFLLLVVEAIVTQNWASDVLAQFFIVRQSFINKSLDLNQYKQVIGLFNDIFKLYNDAVLW